MRKQMTMPKGQTYTGSQSNTSFPRHSSLQMGSAAAPYVVEENHYASKTIQSKKQGNACTAPPTKELPDLKPNNPVNREKEMKFRRDIQNSIATSLKRQRKQNLSRLLQSQNEKAMNNSMSLKQGFEKRQVNFNSSVASFEHYQNDQLNTQYRSTEGEMRASNASIFNSSMRNKTATTSQTRMTNISNMQRIRKIKQQMTRNECVNPLLTQTAKFGDQSSFQSSQFIGTNAHQQAVSPIYLSNKQSNVKTRLTKIDDIKFHKSQNFRIHDYSHFQGSPPDITNIDQGSDERSQRTDSIYMNPVDIDKIQLEKNNLFTGVLQSQTKMSKLAKMTAKTNVGSGHVSSVDLMAKNSHNRNQSTSQMVSQSELKIYRKAGRYDPKSIKNLVVQKMLSTSKKSEYKNFKPKKLDPKHLRDIRDSQNEISELNMTPDLALQQPSEQQSPPGRRTSSSPRKSDQNQAAFQSKISQSRMSGHQSPGGASQGLSSAGGQTLQHSNRRSPANQTSPALAEKEIHSKIQGSLLLSMQRSSQRSMRLRDDSLLPSPAKPIEEENLQYPEDLAEKAEFIVEHGILVDRYKFDPSTINDTLTENAVNRKQQIEDFIARQTLIPPAMREQFREDLMRYLQKQRNLLISYYETNAGKIKGKTESRSVTPNPETHGEGRPKKKVDEAREKAVRYPHPPGQQPDIPHDAYRCQVHKKIRHALSQVYPDAVLSLPSCCKMELLDNNCFEYEYEEIINKESWVQRLTQGKEEKKYRVKNMWFKDEKLEEAYYEKYEDIDTRLLEQMEYYLKFQYEGIYKCTRSKIKAIDAVLDLMKNNRLDGLVHRPADQKLAEEERAHTAFDIDDDLKPISILYVASRAREAELQAAHAHEQVCTSPGLRKTGTNYSKGSSQQAYAGGAGQVRALQKQRVENTLTRLVTQNLGRLMGAKAARQIETRIAQVDEKQLYGTNINQTNLIASKMALAELLEPEKWNNKEEIQLGRVLKGKHDSTVKDLVQGREPAKRRVIPEPEKVIVQEEVLTSDIVQAALAKKKSSIKSVDTKAGLKGANGKGNLGLDQIAALKLIRHRRYEKNFRQRQEEERQRRDAELVKLMLWEDIDGNYMNKIRQCHKYYFRAAQKKEQEKLDQQKSQQKKAYRSPTKIEQEKKAKEAMEVYMNPDLTKEEFFDIINDLVKKYIYKQQQIIDCKRAHSDNRMDEHSHDGSDDSEGSDHHDHVHPGVASGKSSAHHSHPPSGTLQKAGSLKLAEQARSDYPIGGSQPSSGQTTTLHIFQDYIKQNSFYRDLKRNPNSFLKESEQHHVEFGKKCMDGGARPLPTFATMINGKSVVLNNYPMGQSLVEALTRHIEATCQQEAIRAIDNMIVTGCGLNDAQLAGLTGLLQKSKVIKQLKITKEELGEKSIDVLCRLLPGDTKSGRQPLQGLTLNQVAGVADSGCFYKLFKQIYLESSLTQLTIMNINLMRDKKVFEFLIKYLETCPCDLQRLKLQNNNLQTTQIQAISATLVENTYIQDLDLSSNKLCRRDWAANQKILQNLTVFIRHNNKLRHLNLRGMHLYLAFELPKDLMEKPKDAKEVKEVPSPQKGAKKKDKKEAKKSASATIETKNDEEGALNENCFQRFVTVMVMSSSLQAIHLSDNGFNDEQKQSICSLFNIKAEGPEKTVDPSLTIDAGPDEKAEQNASSAQHGDVQIQLNQLKELYLTYEAQNNRRLTDHAKVINNQLIQMFNHSKSHELDGAKTDHALIDVFNDDIILHRKIGHSELVFDPVNNLSGCLTKNIQKNWQLQHKDNVSDCFICQRHQYVQIFFRRSTITDDFEIINDLNMIRILDRIYGLKEKQRNSTYSFLNEEFHVPVLLGSVTDWRAQEMVGGQVYIQLLLYYYLKGELRKLGGEVQDFIHDPQNVKARAELKKNPQDWNEGYAEDLEDLYDTMIEKVLKNQLLVDREECALKNSKWYKLFHNFKKINKDGVTQVNMFPNLKKGEVDVFLFSGYLKPGLHSIIIYDPFENLYYKKTIVVEIGKNPGKKIELENMLDELKSELKRNVTKSVNVFQQWQSDIDAESLKTMAYTGGALLDKLKLSAVKMVETLDTNQGLSKQAARPQYKPAKMSHFLRQAFNIDTIPKNFKPYFFVPDQKEINACLDILQGHFRSIKNLYIYISCSRGKDLSKIEQHGYPFISRDRITDLLVELRIAKKSAYRESISEDDKYKYSAQSMLEEDDEYLSIETVNDIFFQANIEYEDDDANPDDSLNRVELMELFMRIAQAQRDKHNLKEIEARKEDRDLPKIDYKKKTMSEYLKKIIIDKLLPYNADHFEPLVEFRDYLFMNYKQVNVLLEANFRGISLLYTQYFTKGFDKSFNIESLKKLLYDSRLGIKFTEDMNMQLFAFSKMTVVNESHPGRYVKMEFIEFQVMLGLLAKIYFDNEMGNNAHSNPTDEIRYLEIMAQKEEENPVQNDDLDGEQQQNPIMTILGPAGKSQRQSDFMPEQLLFVLDICLRLVNIKCYDFDDIRNQKAFLETQI